MNNRKWEHPRLLFDNPRIIALRHTIEVNESVSGAWGQLLREADDLLQADFYPEELADRKDDQHGNYDKPSFQLSRMGSLLGLTYQVTKNPTYAQKLKEAMLFYGKYNKWHGKGLLNRKPPWHSELNTARFLFGFGVGYDAIYDTLTEEERREIAQAMIRLGIKPTLDDWVLPDNRVHALDSMGHNWWSVCVAEAGLAALSLLDDEPEAADWVQIVSEGLELWFNYQGNRLQNKSPNFDRRGAFYESVTYSNYALEEFLFFRLGCINTFGREAVPTIPLLDHAGEFFLYARYPSSVKDCLINFGDNGADESAATAVKLLLATGCGNDKLLRWYVNRADPEIRAIDLLYYNEIRGGVTGKPDTLGHAVMYPDIGWAVLRSSWAEDATMLAVKSGFTWNHTHADAGSFILYHDGMPLLIDSGACSYGRQEYRNYYVQSRAHNVVLFNGMGQQQDDHYHGVKEPGSLHQLLELKDWKYVYADATGPMSRWFSRNYRHFVWFGDAILIYDDIRSHEEGSFQWLLHYGATLSQADGGYKIANGKASTVVCPLHPAGLDVREEEGLADHHPDQRQAYLTLSTTTPSREAKFLTAIVPSVPYGSTYVEALEGPDWIGARLLMGKSVTEMYVNLKADGRNMHTNSNHRIAEWETDAYLFAFVRPQHAAQDDTNAIQRILIAGGSYLRFRGRIIFDSLSKAFTVFTVNGESMEIVIQGQPIIRASYLADIPPNRLHVNGELTSYTYDKAHKMASIQSDVH